VDALDPYSIGADVSFVIGVVSLLAQSDYFQEVWEVLIGMLRDYRARVHARGLAELEPDCAGEE